MKIILLWIVNVSNKYTQFLRLPLNHHLRKQSIRHLLECTIGNVSGVIRDLGISISDKLHT